MAVVMDVVEAAAIADVQRGDPAVHSMGPSGGGHAGQDESPSHEARNQ